MRHRTRSRPRPCACAARTARCTTDSAQGTGPVDAVYQAINRIVGQPNELIEFSVNAITEGIDAVGEVTIRIEDETRSRCRRKRGHAGCAPPTFSGYGVNLDIIVAAADAYMGALNKLIAARNERTRHRAASYVEANAPNVALDLFGNSSFGRTVE